MVLDLLNRASEGIKSTFTDEEEAAMAMGEMAWTTEAGERAAAGVDTELREAQKKLAVAKERLTIVKIDLGDSYAELQQRKKGDLGNYHDRGRMEDAEMKHKALQRAHDNAQREVDEWREKVKALQPGYVSSPVA